ncbi:MAG: PepSY domain-containing protein [Eubacterium sp.]|nr:PepSY domain-containing protein [Eubacterium sp.]
MKKKMKKTISAIISTACVALTVFSSTVAFATTPKKEDVEYKGSGKVEVEFIGDVSWKGTPKVTVKDTSGKTYKTSIISYDDDEINFKIKSYKTGKKYNFRISKVRKKGTKEYGTVKGSVSIPKKAKNPISKAKAKSIALNHAEKTYKINKSKIYDYEIEKDTYKGKSVWNIEFEAKKNGKKYSYEYKIQRSSGKILYHEQELDD